MRFQRAVCLLVVFMLAGTGAVWGFNVSVTTPTLGFTGDLGAYIDGSGDIDVDQINQLLSDQSGVFRTELQGNEDLQRFSKQPKLAEGFANAGATAAHLGTQRSFIDYRRFAFVIGTGAALSAPTADINKAMDAAESIENEGDIYIGAAIQPISASLGLNLSRWVPGLRTSAKIGYANIADGTIEDGVSFESISVGVGATYQLVQPRALPAGVIRWRGVSVGSGFNYQRNKTNIEFEATGDDGFRSDVTFADLGISDADTQAIMDDGSATAAGTTFGELLISPRVIASIESRTYAIPLEINTGIRFLYLLEFNVGAGVDVVFGESEIAVGSSADVAFDANSAIADEVVFTPGRANLGIRTTSDPQLLRPRLTAGLGANLGPVKLDIPLMYYFDSEGPSAMVGVNLGIVW